MEPTKQSLNKKSLIVIINNIKGSISKLNIILEKIMQSNTIDFLFLTGEVFSLQTKIDDIFSIKFKGQTIIFDSSPIGEIIRSKFEYEPYILKNNVFLNRSGIYTPENSALNICYLSGFECKELLEKNGKDFIYTNKYYKYKDLKNILDKFNKIKNTAKKKIDFVLLNSLPECYYSHYYEQIKTECGRKNVILNEKKIINSVSYCTNFLLHLFNPRYVITSVDDFFFKNINDRVMNTACYRTFFYNLGYLENKINMEENFYVAFNYKSLNCLTQNEILSLETEQELKTRQKFIINRDLFKNEKNYDIKFTKTPIENFDDYLYILNEKKRLRSMKDDIPEVKALLISNLDYNLTKEDELKRFLMENYGTLRKLKLLTNKDNGKFNGKAIVNFNEMDAVTKLLNENGKLKINDRLLRIIVYTPRDQLNNNNNLNFTISNNNNNINNNNNHHSCWFCYDSGNLDKKYIIKTFNYFYLAYSKGPIDKYHFLLIPKKHISSYSNLTFEEKTELKSVINNMNNFLKSKNHFYINFIKNLKYNFDTSIHILINIVGLENNYLNDINDYIESFFLNEKINEYTISYDDKILDTFSQNDEYVYINIPLINKGEIWDKSKSFIIKTKEYKIDYPRKLICGIINKTDRINWKDTMGLGEKYLEENKNEITEFFNE